MVCHLSHTPVAPNIWEAYRYTTVLPIYRGERCGASVGPAHMIEAGVGSCVGFWDKGDTGVTSHHAVWGITVSLPTHHSYRYRVLGIYLPYFSPPSYMYRRSPAPHAHRRSHLRRAVLRAACLVKNSIGFYSEPYTSWLAEAVMLARAHLRSLNS